MLETTALSFPLDYILTKVRRRQRRPSEEPEDDGGRYFESYEEELRQPLTVTVDEIAEDLKKFAEHFPYDLIPHVMENNEINDVIHNYRGTVQASMQKEQRRAMMMDRIVPPKELVTKNIKLTVEQKKPSVRHEDLEAVKEDLREEKLARMIGLIAHLVYWNVFGDRLNALKLDSYHKKLLFI